MTRFGTAGLHTHMHKILFYLLFSCSLFGQCSPGIVRVLPGGSRTCAYPNSVNKDGSGNISIDGTKVGADASTVPGSCTAPALYIGNGIICKCSASVFVGFGGSTACLPSISTTSLPGGSVGVAYSQTIAGTTGTSPYTWSVLTGSLPAGLSLNTSTGVVSGTPTTVQISTFTIKLLDSAKQIATKSLSITVTDSGAVIRTDNFERADGALGVNWGFSMSHAMTIASGAAINPTSGDSDGIWTGDSFGDDQFSEIQVKDSTSITWMGVWIRRDVAQTQGYLGFCLGSTLYIYYATGGVNLTSLGASGSGSCGVGDVLKFVVTGNSPATLSLYRNGTLVVTGTDSGRTWHGGAPGFALNSGGSSSGAIEAWAGGEGDGAGTVFP